MVRFVRQTLCLHLLALSLTALCGCGVLPQVAYQPSIHNPFPQLAKVAVAPFFNLSTETTADGRQFALAYFSELQTMRGFEVVPIGVVEQAMLTHQIDLNGPEDARRLAQVLGVDAVVIGAITDYSPYYPPRCALKVEWYAANPSFHPIPPGYGLPWGTAEEEDIPESLIFEAEFALARAQLATQTPDCGTEPLLSPLAQEGAAPVEGQPLSHHEPLDGCATDTTAPDGANVPGGASVPADWPDPRGFIPPAPSPHRAPCQPSNRPVLQHTRTFNGHDADFTTALESYYFFRDDQRSGGWPSYLQRSDDFIRFCCHMHLAEMLTARGGAGKSRVVWRWAKSR